jgi:hypothetical protein
MPTELLPFKGEAGRRMGQRGGPHFFNIGAVSRIGRRLPTGRDETAPSALWRFRLTWLEGDGGEKWPSL